MDIDRQGDSREHGEDAVEGHRLAVAPYQSGYPVPYQEGACNEQGDERVHQYKRSQGEEQGTVRIYGRGEEFRDSVKLDSPYEGHDEKD